MAHVLVMGASGGIGGQTVSTALLAGHQVRAFSRSADIAFSGSDTIETFKGDATNSEDVDAALDGVDVVVQALGVATSDLFKTVDLFSKSTRLLVDAMQKRGVRRLICVTGFGAGDSRDAIGLIQAVPFRLLLGRAYDDKDVQERLIKQSELDWTIVRPGILTNAPRSGRYRVLHKPSEWRNGVIGRADVADFIVQAIDDPSTIGKEPVLIW
ncbi:MAG: SDR family oxidoreductase [Methyloceanibacter sp.]|nr:SDR family oxidoreductase [Methyloceanibacter sp.]